ncbi:Bardet-Biedl syndrome 2 protein homolog [Tetranychus urticae]|uniref:Bardet-Biedl syndrome 2 protein homolog n=1 Tax=Tetranychus urticae TaxID=32264 RepID=T1K3F9_TETUR|nr:Bardet-Biedl syndrome 2 protein homolog [Tetranychus urticae]
MLKTVFTINLNEKIQPGQVAVGKFDGINPCIVAVTTSDKVLLHNPLRRSQQTSERRWSQPSAGTDVTFLNVNQTIRSLTVGCLKTDSEADVLVLGTPISILTYDVMNNVDIFYREIPDGANALVVGKIGSIESPLAIAGGNCAIQGFDAVGNDCYWTVTGDNITTLALWDIDGDQQNELIVGSEDYDIRVFKEESIFLEMSETDSIKCVCPLIGDCFAYALVNGTVGVYSKKERLWRIKSKNQAICILGFDVNNDGRPELITGWSSGKIDARNMETGEVIFKDNLNSSIAAIMTADYNLDGVVELVVISVSGEIKGYQTNSGTERPQPVLDITYEQETIRDLMKRKQNLLLELRNYESNVQFSSSTEPLIHGKASTEDDHYGAIPADTQLKSALILNIEDSKPSVDLTLQTTNETIIRMVVIFAEGIFKGESHVVHPPESEVSGTLNIPLRPPKDMPIDLHIKSIVGYKGSYHFHVFELSRHLPRFSMYALRKNTNFPESSKPKGWVNFNLGEKVSRICLWLNRNFLLVEEFEYLENLDVTFISLRDNKLLIFEMDGKSGSFTIRTNSMEIAGQVVQSLAVEYLNLPDLSSTVDFPGEIENLKKLITKVEEMQSVRASIDADIAENSVAVRSLVVRSEDARLLREWKMVKQLYMDLNVLNRELIHEYQIRSHNHQDLVDSLKQINVIIQKAANLRVGPSKTKIVQLCRLAIKDNNLNSLARIICRGEA